MRHYEIMIILDPNLEERTVQPSLEGFLKVVTDDGGKVGKLDIWGKRRLSYPIDKKPEGIYAVVDLTPSRTLSRSSTASSTSTRACCGPRFCGPSTADRPP